MDDSPEQAIELVFEEVLFECARLDDDDEAGMWLALKAVKDRLAPHLDDPPGTLVTPSEFRVKAMRLRARLAR